MGSYRLFLGCVVPLREKRIVQPLAQFNELNSLNGLNVLNI